MSSPRLTNVSAVCLALQLTACQPEKAPGGGDDTAATTGTDGNSDTGHADGTTGAATSTTTDAEDPTTGGPGPASDSDPGSTSTSTTGAPDPTGSDPVCGGTGEDQPPGPLVGLGPADPDEVDAYGGEFGGRFSVTASRWAEDAQWQVSAFAEFFDVPEASESVMCAVEVDPLTGIDDCGVRWYGGLGWGGAEVLPRSAGSATLLGPGWTEPMVMGMTPQKYYDADILGSGHPAGWGEAYGITWAGERLPAGELPQFVTLPAELKITAPAGVSWTFGDGPFELAWTGTGAAPLQLRAQFVEPEGHTTWFELVCKIADDGSFVVPAEVVTLLPPGWSGLGGLRRAVSTTAEAADRTIVGVAAVAIDLEVAVAP
ncbi:MAG TPA: hypothetical protein VGB85_19935 [Nannocystis sp.]